MDDFGDIAGQFKKAQRNAEKKASRAVRKAIISTGDQIITGMPVVTGRLRNNWQTTLNTRSFSQLEAGNDATSNLVAAVSNLKFGDTCFLTNNLPYAQFIEYGDYEGQHSQGVVRKAIAEFKDKLAKYVKQEGIE